MDTKYNTRRCLSFGYRGKATTTTAEVNMFKIVSEVCTDIIVCN
jgi:hypothetical protein